MNDRIYERIRLACVTVMGGDTMPSAIADAIANAFALHDAERKAECGAPTSAPRKWSTTDVVRYITARYPAIMVQTVYTIAHDLYDLGYRHGRGEP